MDWWRPEALQASERAARLSTAVNLNEDFGSYRKALRDGLAGSNIDAHNAVRPHRRVRWICKTLGIRGKQSLLDAGCGLGFTADAFKRHLPESSVLGIDVSADAIDYATAHFPNVAFTCEAIRPDGPDLGRFSLIYCAEFYPFTRNTDVAAQSAFLRYFARQLTPGGKIVLFQKWKNVESLSTIIDQVREHSALRIDVVEMPHPSLPRIPFAMLASEAIEILCKREVVKRLIVVSGTQT